MRCPSFALIACLAAGCAGLPKAGGSLITQSGEGGAPVVENDPAAESAADLGTRKMLEDKIIETAAFNGDSLETALNFVRDQTGVNMVVLWGSIECAGVRRDRAITLQLKRVSAAQLLKAVLEDASADFEGESRLGYAIENGIVKVATRKEFWAVTLEHIYDVRDLLVQAPDFAEAPTFTLNGGDTGGGSAGSYISTSEDPDASQARLEELISRIKNHVGTREEWDNSMSVISAYGGQLLVKTTPENHRALAELLAGFRKQRGLGVALQARVLRMPPAELEKISAQTRGTLELDGAGVEAFMAHAVEKSSGIQILSAGRQRCMSGQRTYVLGGGQKAFVADLSSPTITEAKETKDGKETKSGQESAVGKDAGPLVPTVSSVQGGLLVDTQATASADHRQVITTLRASFADLSALRPVPVGGGAQIEAPELALLQWRTTTTIPNGGAVLLTAAAPAKPGQNAMETMLLLQATVVEPKNK